MAIVRYSLANTSSLRPVSTSETGKENAHTGGKVGQRKPENRSSVDISGPIRKALVGGIWYVVGDDVLIPTRDEEEATALVIELTSRQNEE